MSRKHTENQRTPGAYRFGAFELYPSERQLYSRKKPIALQPKAFDALLLLVKNAERLVRRDELMEALWPDTFVTDANLTNIIVSLRKIVGRQAIQTVSKFGYRLTLPVTGEPNVDPETYAAFVRAKALVDVRSVDAVVTARDLLSLCVANDPAFAAAWAWLGRCYRFLEKFDIEPALNLELAQAAFARALVIDPDLAPAHHFYTQLQADLGHAREAMVRLATRIAQKPGDAGSYAGLVQVLRFCGLLDASVAAHEKARTLDPAIATSVCHTQFLRGNYKAAIDQYQYLGTKYYLDAAAWAALGQTTRAIALLRERIASSELSPLMSPLMESLLATLENRRDDALSIINARPFRHEPEARFYLARHCAMCDAATETVALLQQARAEGFTSSAALERDQAFAALRPRPEFQRELGQAKDRERETRRAFEQAGDFTK